MFFDDSLLWRQAFEEEALPLMTSYLKGSSMTSAIGIIPPEVSRHVHVIMSKGAAPWAGIISAVHGDRRISVAAFTEDGRNCALPGIHLRQPDEALTGEFPHAQWMPYSVKQAGFVQAELVEEPQVDSAPLGSGGANAASGTSLETSATAGGDGSLNQ